MAGLCPHCGSPISHVTLDEVSVTAKGAQWVGVTYSCSICMKILSVGIDPIAIKTDIVDEIVDQLRKR